MFISLIKLMISLLVAGSRFPVGSSAKIISGLLRRALAIATLCCSPPESSLGYFSVVSSSFTLFKTSEILASISFFSFH